MGKFKIGQPVKYKGKQYMVYDGIADRDAEGGMTYNLLNVKTDEVITQIPAGEIG